LHPQPPPPKLLPPLDASLLKYIWSSSAESIGEDVSAISSFANKSRSHGCTPSDEQPLTKIITAENNEHLTVREAKLTLKLLRLTLLIFKVILLTTLIENLLPLSMKIVLLTMGMS
jgi:uncharacterized membrane protein